ncbi:MAG: glutamyl-tRNA reductase [Altererythrobacter sp.]|nr:glutamyl-tRNA reductase [Altererythrobacter sp.]
MSLLAFGINHQTAPVAIRERVAFAPESLLPALQDLTERTAVNEAAILSTCNRTEVYCGLDAGDTDVVLNWLEEFHRLERSELEPFVYRHPDQFAVRHMLRVASGLDSMVLGEPQILGQMKDAYQLASEAGTIGKMLSKLFQHTFSVAKQIRTDTAIGHSPVSVAFAAVALAKQIFGDLNDSTVLLIGAGETIELAARHLKESGIGRIIIANRTVERAHALATELDGYAIALSEMPKHLAEADIVISSTASTLPILGKGSVESALKQRKHKPMFMVDIAVPRDIEPEVDELDDVYLYSVDDLQEIIEENLKSRQDAAHQAEEIIDTQVTHFMGWMRSLESITTIRAFREQAEHQRDETLIRALAQLERGENPEQVMRELARLLTNKLTHTPSVQIRQASYDGRMDVLDVVRELFDLGNEP